MSETGDDRLRAQFAAPARERDARAQELDAANRRADALDGQCKAVNERLTQLQRENEDLRTYGRRMSRLLLERSSAAEVEELPRDLLASLIAVVDAE